MSEISGKWVDGRAWSVLHPGTLGAVNPRPPRRQGDSNVTRARADRLAPRPGRLLGVELDDVGFLPASRRRAIRPGTLLDESIEVPEPAAQKLLRSIIRLVADIPAGSPPGVVWQLGRNELLAHTETATLACSSGLVRVGFVVECDQLDKPATVTVPIAVGTAAAPKGLVMSRSHGSTLPRQSPPSSPTRSPPSRGRPRSSWPASCAPRSATTTKDGRSSRLPSEPRRLVHRHGDGAPRHLGPGARMTINDEQLGSFANIATAIGLMRDAVRPTRPGSAIRSASRTRAASRSKPVCARCSPTTCSATPSCGSSTRCSAHRSVRPTTTRSGSPCSTSPIRM